VVSQLKVRNKDLLCILGIKLNHKLCFTDPSHCGRVGGLIKELPSPFDSRDCVINEEPSYKYVLIHVVFLVRSST
jgi:hypothetical protein